MCVVDGTQYWRLLDCRPNFELRMRVLVFSLTVMGRSGTRQRPVHGHRYPVRTAFSVMLIVLES